MYGGMGGMGNMAGMMKKVQKLQSQMKTMQEDLKKRTVEVTAGGGAVKVVVNGDKEIQSLVIDKAAVDPEDVETLQDMILAAANQALMELEQDSQEQMGKLTGGMGLGY